MVEMEDQVTSQSHQREKGPAKTRLEVVVSSCNGFHMSRERFAISSFPGGPFFVFPKMYIKVVSETLLLPLAA